MGDVPIKPNILFDKLTNSTKKNKNINIPNNTSINNTATSTDNVNNDITMRTQYSDNIPNHTVIANNHESKYNIINNNNINKHIQSVPNTNLLLNQNTHINTFNKK